MHLTQGPLLYRHSLAECGPSIRYLWFFHNLEDPTERLVRNKKQVTAIMMFGKLPSRAKTDKRQMVFSLPTISFKSMGLYFSTQGDSIAFLATCKSCVKSAGDETIGVEIATTLSKVSSQCIKTIVQAINCSPKRQNSDGLWNLH